MQHRRAAWRVVVALAGGVLAVVVIWALNRTPSGRTGPHNIDEILAGMSLEEKIGQMVMAGFPGTELGAEANTLISKYHLGGVMMSTRNIRDTKQIAELNSQLQRLALKSGAKVPLLIAADQEGGYVVRLRGEHQFPGNMALGAAGSPELTKQVAVSMGRELKAAGFNMDFAPVLDVNSNPGNPVIGVRSFGENPALVAQMGAAFIAGLHEAGILATAKHFPGHGDTAQDSHIALPSVAHPRSRLERVELYPFRQAIAAGVDAIMTAHVTFPAIEPTPGLPATLSAKTLTGLLRDEMGFAGIAITDAMEMQAITENFGLAEAAVKAVLAGADIVLVAWPTDWQQSLRVVEALVEAAEKGAIPQARIDAAVRRVLTAKERMHLWDNATRVRPLDSDERKELAEVSSKAAAQAVTLVRDNQKRLPLTTSNGKVLVVVPAIGSITGAEDANAPRVALAQALRRYLPDVGEVSCPSKPDKAARDTIVAQAAGYGTVVVATYYAWSNAYSGQAALVEELRKAGKEPIVVALREPYDLKQFPAISTYLAAYSANSESLTAVAEVLAGKRTATGRLPVSIPGVYQAAR